MKQIRKYLSLFLILALLASMAPVYAMERETEASDERSIHEFIELDEEGSDGYRGDYVVIYNPTTSSYSSGYSTGTMTGLIETSVGTNANAESRQAVRDAVRPYKLDVDQLLPEAPRQEETKEGTKASFDVGSKKTFYIYSTYSPTGSGSVEFKCLAVGAHCYIWTPTSTASNVYPLDGIDPTFAGIAAAEFDSKFSLMQSSFGDHTNGSQGDGKLHILYYNIDDGWTTGQPYVAGFFYQGDISNNGLPMLNIDTYPGVTYPDSNGQMQTRIDDTYGTMVHEYQHLINYSNAGLSSWLNECFSAAAEEICYPGSSVIPRIQSWEHYYYATANDWLTPPAEHAYDPSSELHNGYSLYAWSNGLDDILALYAQVSLFAQYLYTRFGNTIYKQISDNYSGSEVSAISAATGVDCAQLAKEFRIAVTANADLSQYGGIYGFQPQNGYDPAGYHDVQNPYSLLAPVVFTGTSCTIAAGGSITVKPVGGVYNPPADANANLKYIGISFTPPFNVTAIANNDAWGTLSVQGTRITAVPIDGYYVAGYEVVSGAATASINVNVIDVTPSSDCVIRILFAPKPTYTVSFLASGVLEGQQTAQIYDSITLPSSVNVTAEGWSFSGWSETQLAEETTEKPVLFLPGSSYTVLHDTTLYAVFTRVESGTELAFECLTEAPAEWEGNYLITYGTTTSLELLKAISAGSSYENAGNGSTITYASSGMTLDGAYLYNASDAFVWEIAAQGSGYTIRSKGNSSYLGCNNTYLNSIAAYSAAKCTWTLEYASANHATRATNEEGGSNTRYPYLSHSTQSTCFVMNSANGFAQAPTQFWRETIPSTTYYITEPVAGEHEHELVYVAPSDATCTANGNLAHWRCTICNRCYSDANGENEIIPAGSVIIPALGHDYEAVVTEPTCTEAGYTTHHCTRCGVSYTDTPVAALGHDCVYTVAVDPTTETQGLLSGTCARCQETLTVTLPVLSTTDYDYSVVTGASCTATGVGRYTWKTTSYGSFSFDVTLAALGHEYAAVVTEPSCTEPGYTTYTCARCGDSYVGDATEALGHEYAAVVTEPTCTEPGYTIYTCARCGSSYVGDATEALGHVWNEGEATLAATHRAPGVMTYTCARCGETRTEEIPRLPNPFEDVSEPDYFFNPVMWALDEQVTAGIDDNHYGPHNNCTREQIVTFLWAANGRPEPETSEMTFNDVSESDWFYAPVLWAVEHGYTSGIGDGSFGVGQSCTRAQAMTFLWAAQGKPDPASTQSPFTDVTEGDWFYNAILWAAEHEVTAGIGDGLFGVNNTCTRAQIITFLFKVYEA